MTPAERIQEVLHAADQIISLAQKWASDDKLPNTVPDELGAAIESAELINHQGDIPYQCQDLVYKVSRLAEDQRKYDAAEPETRMRNGDPSQAWWASLQNVIKARAGAEGPRRVRLESVAELLKQGVSRMQIAGAIFGRRGVGPLMQSNGIPDDALIDRERDVPGSVLIGWPDWVPPWEKEIESQQKLKLSGQLQVLARRSEPRRYTDPATVEEMLRDGCYVQQIMKGKNVTREHVLQVAADTKQKAVDQPGWMPETVLGTDVGEQEDAPGDAEKEKIRDRVVAIWNESGQSLGAAEIVAKLREEGLEATTRSIGGILNWSRRKATETVEA